MHNAPRLCPCSAHQTSSLMARELRSSGCSRGATPFRLRLAVYYFFAHLFLLPLKHTLPQGDTHSVAMEFMLRRIQSSTLYRHPGRSTETDDTDQSGLTWAHVFECLGQMTSFTNLLINLGRLSKLKLTLWSNMYQINTWSMWILNLGVLTALWSPNTVHLCIE